MVCRSSCVKVNKGNRQIEELLLHVSITTAALRICKNRYLWEIQEALLCKLAGSLTIYWRNNLKCIYSVKQQLFYFIFKQSMLEYTDR